MGFKFHAGDMMKKKKKNNNGNDDYDDDAALVFRYIQCTQCIRTHTHAARTATRYS